MKRGQKRTNVSTKHKIPKSVSRRVKVTASESIVHRNRMKRHLMLNRQVNEHRNTILNGPEERVVKAMLGMSIRNTNRSRNEG